METEPSRDISREIPYSKMVYPDHPLHRLKYYFWRAYTPCHPYCRDTVVSLGIMVNEGRQDFLIGRIASHSSLGKTIDRLVSQGYGLHIVAWKDEGEVVSLRRVENFTHQHHVRIFEDGEVRGHYEYTPEAYPFLHLNEILRDERHEEFLAHLGGHITPRSPAEHAGRSGGRAKAQWGFLPRLKRLFS